MTATRMRLPSGREVIDTGKVRIGLRAGEYRANPDLGISAEMIQQALLRSSNDSRIDHHILGFGGHMQPMRHSKRRSSMLRRLRRVARDTARWLMGPWP